jgi:sugar-specific transcriptional regulator TrmB
MNEPEAYLRKLGLSESEITAYLRMAAGAESARDLLKTTKMKRPTVYYALNSLEKRGLISKSGKENDAAFTLAPFQRLVAIAKEKEDEAVQLTEQVGELIAGLGSSKGIKIEKPTVSFFEGIDAVKHVVMDVMYAKQRTVELIVPEHTFFWGFGEEFLRKYIEERRSRNIKTRNLWEATIDAKEFKRYYTTQSEIRMLPTIMKGKFKSTVFLFDDKTLYVSSYENAYAILVVSAEHHDTMHALFEGLWSTAKPYPIKGL